MPTVNPPEFCEKFFARVKELYTLPGVVMKSTQILTDQGSTAQDLADVISMDVTLTAKLLRLVNSAYYGFAGRIGSLKMAIVILGYKKVRNIILGLGTIKTLQNRSGAFSTVPFWRHCLATALFTESLLTQKAPALRDEGFVAGLLHDIGQLIMFQEASDSMASVFELTANGMAVSEAEESVFGFDHAALGACLSSVWHYPENLTEAIRCHHGLPNEGPHQTLAAAVHLSNVCVKSALLDRPGNGPLEAADPKAWDLLRMKASDLAPLYRQLPAGLAMLDDILDNA